MTTSATTAPVLPDTALARATLELVVAVESPSIANHSVRTYLFGVLLAEHRGLRRGHDFDDQLLFLSCLLHDIGLSDRGNREQRFEVDGADVAAEFLALQGLPGSDVDTVWEAIALHTSAGIAERRGPVAEYTRRGVGVDLGRDTDWVTEEQAAAIHAQWPRLATARTLADEIVAQATSRPEKAPRYSIADYLVTERATAGVTLLEQAAALSRWGS